MELGIERVREEADRLSRKGCMQPLSFRLEWIPRYWLRGERPPFLGGGDVEG